MRKKEELAKDSKEGKSHFHGQIKRTNTNESMGKILSTKKIETEQKETCHKPKTGNEKIIQTLNSRNIITLIPGCSQTLKQLQIIQAILLKANTNVNS